MDAQPQMRVQGPIAVGLNSRLWMGSRSWRMLVISSWLLTSMAISAPLVLPQAASESCKLQIDTAPHHVSAKVVGFVTEDQTLSTTRAVEAQLGAKISPGYLPLKRVHAVGYPTHQEISTLAAVPDNIPVKTGDVVDLNTRYRDPSLPCNFIPWTVNRILQSGGAN